MLEVVGHPSDSDDRTYGMHASELIDKDSDVNDYDLFLKTKLSYTYLDEPISDRLSLSTLEFSKKRRSGSTTTQPNSPVEGRGRKHKDKSITFPPWTIEIPKVDGAMQVVDIPRVTEIDWLPLPNGLDHVSATKLSLLMEMIAGPRPVLVSTSTIAQANFQNAMKEKDDTIATLQSIINSLFGLENEHEGGQEELCQQSVVEPGPGPGLYTFLTNSSLLQTIASFRAPYRCDVDPKYLGAFV
ncbi:hypothetical protein L484_016085 [Morus notabilis]|uniref:Uncharacterized protein n=1 Tax=Morus notabilis TaxID=981085 RepID=W9SG74_9ROSA|nr:hypothetical protein L484_016085 [Morus notabilis]